MREWLRDADVVHERRWYTLLVLCLCLMVIGIDNTILNVALPTLAKPEALGGLGASPSELQWIVDAYTIVFAGLLLTAGSLGDRFGRYRALTFGLGVFGMGSVLSALATSATMLIATRALMGVGGAFIMPSTLSILTNTFTERRERAKAIGIWSGVSAAGVAFGPLLGGILLAHFWWGSVFLVNVPVILAALTFGFLLVPESRDPATPKLDPVGSGLSTVGLVILLWAIIEAPANGWLSAPTLVGFGLAAIVLVGFLAWELRSTHPMLEIRFFRNPRFSVASAAIMFTFVVLYGMLFLLTQYYQTVLGYSTVQAGAVLIPQALLLMVFAVFSSHWVHRYGNKLVVAAGLGIIALMLVLMATLNESSPPWMVVGVTGLLGVGMGNVMPPATESIMGAVPKEKAGIGSAMNDTTRQVGGALGVALFGSILASQYSASIASNLAGVPATFVQQAQKSVGSAIGLVADTPAARPFAEQITKAAQEAFVSAFHIVVLVGALIIVGIMLGVLRWLPSRASDDPRATATAVDAVPMGIGPVDVVPANLAADLADELEFGRGSAAGS
jgi:EmrB/QacA subfamily drug resistance transporter